MGLWELFDVLSHFSIFLVQHFVFVSFTTDRFRFLEVLIQLFNVSLIGLNELLQLDQLSILLQYLSIVLLDSLDKSLSSFWERQIRLVGLEFKLFLLLDKLHSLFL